ncbi:MAG TPA: hypothetical protein VJO16_19215 [Candidatus Acidoferrum sp.]|nr:hypothetical protein [Candidatus Acidoferrum sp.]
MDVFKLAFETIVVGLLAFVWLAVAAYLFSPDFLSDLVSRQIPAFAKDNQTLLGVAVLTVAYCLGSAILPISNQLLNDEHWPLPENAIRCQVFTQQQTLLQGIDYTALPKHLSLDDMKPVHCSYWAPVLEGGVWHGIRTFIRLLAPSPFVKADGSASGDDAKKEKILSLFQLQESKLLNQSTEGEQLKQLHERIVVLRGAVFSGFVLSLLCLFAYFARVFGNPAHWIRTTCGGLLAICFAAFALLNGWQDLLNHKIFDIPVLEGLVSTIVIFGAILVIRGVKTPLFMKKRYLCTVIFFAALAYGGWMSSEIIYDQQVISSFAAYQAGETPKH